MNTRAWAAILVLASSAGIVRAPHATSWPAPAPFVPDATLKEFDSTPPAAPVIRVRGLARGRPGEGRGFICVDVAGADGGSALFRGGVNTEIGYRFHVVDGALPRACVLPAGAWRAIGVEPAIFIDWPDGETWTQDAFRCRMYVTAVDYAGNESPPSNIVVVEHDGNMEKERARADAELKRHAEATVVNREYRAIRQKFDGRWIGKDENGLASMMIRSDAISWTAGGQTRIGSLDARPIDDPDQIAVDVVIRDERDRLTVYHGLCEFSGDTLRLRVADVGKPRPTAIKGAIDGSVTLFLLTRWKPPLE